jgi:hypothetical protein
MQQYITDNNLPNKSSDTSTTGDIYDYVVEGLSAGATTVVIVELTTASWCIRIVNTTTATTATTRICSGRHCD